MADELLNAKVGGSSASSSVKPVPANPKAKGKESPRSAAHQKLLTALSNLDADALRKAIHEASQVGVDPEGLAAVQTALQELEAPGAIGTFAERQRAAAKLEVVAKDGSEAEIQEAILEAIDVGLEDGFAVAEAALAKRRAERHDLIDSLVAAMEVVVISAEQDGVNGPGCCAPEQLETLADVLVEARTIAIPGEEELLNAATRLLEFELKRSEAVRTLNVRLRQHARDMEKIVDDFQRSLGGTSPSASQRATAKLEEALDTSTPQWTRQSFLRRGSRRTKDRTVADEAPALPGAGVETDLRPDLKALAVNSGPLASVRSSTTPTPRSKASASPSTVGAVGTPSPMTTLSQSPRSSTLGYPKHKVSSPAAPEIPKPMVQPVQPRVAQPKAEVSAPTAAAPAAPAAPPTATASPAKAAPKAGIQIGRSVSPGVSIGKAKSSADLF